jgi:CheY-like chemotaxis protein
LRVSLRTKLSLIVVVMAATLVVSLLVNRELSSLRLQRIDDMQARIVPRISLAPKLEAEFEHLRLDMQNAVAAQDRTALAAALKRKEALFNLISEGRESISAQDAAFLRHAIGDYSSAAEGVSRRLIAGEAGEAIGGDIEAMQAKQAVVIETMKRATALGHNELGKAFGDLRAEAERSSDLRMWLGFVSLILVLGISIWTGRNVVRSVHEVSQGLSRFGTGSFTEPIEVTSQDELGDIGVAANKMASNLSQLNTERERVAWLKESLAGLSEELLGDLSPSQVTSRALRFLSSRIGAMVATFHVSDDTGVFQLASHYGLDDRSLPQGEPGHSFRLNQGLSGRVAAHEEILIVSDPPEDYLTVRSSLGENPPKAIVLVPLAHLGVPLALLEFALLSPCTDRVRELLDSMRAGLVVALVAAQVAQAQRELLVRTQALAERLAAQEEELRVNNQELESQQEVLRNANEELEAQRATLSERNSELERARQELQEKAGELSRMSAYKSQFLANMSHELRTPLNSMLILSHLLAENEGARLSDKQVEHARTIHSAGKDLLGLINAVLDLAKIEAGHQEVFVDAVEIASISAYVQRVFEPLASEKGLRLAVYVDADAPTTIQTDRQRLERILTNLIGNAIKFTDQGSVTLEIRRPGVSTHFARNTLSLENTVAFAVVDTGVGIAESAHEKVFAPFEQVDSGANRRHAGTGLGLAISRESAQLLGGELQLSSTPGKGSTFTCYLPEVIESGSKRDSSRPPPVTQAAPPVRGPASALHMLVIEDDAVVAEQLVEIIQARQLTVRVARTGQEGLDIARTERPRGIVLDVKLPDIEGWTVMERLRRDPVTASIPVHFISAVEAPQRGLALGAIGYLTKPVSRDELVGVVRVLVPSSSQERPRVLVVEDSSEEGASLIALLGKEDVDLLHVRSAHEALTALGSQTFGCMILDLGLPDMDGLGLLEALRARTHVQWPRVVVHTGRALTKQETRALEAYAEAIVLKDGSSAQRLVEEVRLFLRHVREQGQNAGPSEDAVMLAELSFKGHKILIAEDDMRTVYAVSALLRAKGAQVVVAETGREALDALASNPDISLVLMDVMMPEMDGYEAMRRLRADPQFATLPVIALTAKAMKGERERCLAAGASDYLAKPVDSGRLLGTLGKWLQRGGASDARSTA